MSRFTEILLVSPLPDGKNWVIKKDFGYAVGDEYSDHVIDVPIGFVTDFASVPRPFWWIFPKWGKYGNAAVIHDYLYWTKTVSRKNADDIFLEAMEVLKVNKVAAWILHKAVCWFGWIVWNSNDKKKAARRNKVSGKLPEKVTDWEPPK